jgi:hypothetical protein
MKHNYLALTIGLCLFLFSCTKESETPEPQPVPTPQPPATTKPVLLTSWSVYYNNGVDTAIEVFVYDDSFRVSRINAAYYEREDGGPYRLTPVTTRFVRDAAQRISELWLIREKSYGTFSEIQRFTYENATSKKLVRSVRVAGWPTSAPWLDSASISYSNNRISRINKYLWSDGARRFVYADSFKYTIDGKLSEIVDINETTTPGVFSYSPIPLVYDGKPNPLFINEDAIAISRNKQKWVPENVVKFGLQNISYEYRADGRVVKMIAPDFTAVYRYSQ